MGNAIPAASATADDLRTHLAQLPGFVTSSARSLNDRKFLKTLRCRRGEDSVVVKIYFKRTLTRAELLPFAERILSIARIMSPATHPNVLPYRVYHESAAAAFAVRQHIMHNLVDRTHSVPLLSSVDRRWIAFQLVKAVEQCHANGVYHGDIKSENVLLTSWNWVMLTDLAPFKPTYLPADTAENPELLSYFFETASHARRGSCLLAPERFAAEFGTDGGAESRAVRSGSITGELQPAMDIFSLGCVHFIYRYILCESCSRFDLPPLPRQVRDWRALPGRARAILFRLLSPRVPRGGPRAE